MAREVCCDLESHRDGERSHRVVVLYSTSTCKGSIEFNIVLQLEGRAEDGQYGN